VRRGSEDLTSHIDRLARTTTRVFPIQLARSRRAQSQNRGMLRTTSAFNETTSYRPTGLRNWIGFLAHLGRDAVGARTVVTPGKGLCGQPRISSAQPATS